MRLVHELLNELQVGRFIRLRRVIIKLSIVLSTDKASFKAVSFKGNLSTNAARIASLGYEGIELAVRNPDSIDHDQVIKIIKKYKLTVPAIGTGQAWAEDGLSFTDKDQLIRQKAIERIDSHISFAKKINAVIIIGLLRGVISRDVSEEQAEEWVVEALKTCTAKASIEGVRIAFEPINRYETSLTNTAAQGLELIDKIGAENLGLLLDTFHMNIEEPSIEESIRICKDKIFHFHVADSNRFYPGAGHIDFKSILETLFATGYRGFVSGEFMPYPDADISAARAIKYLRRLGIDSSLYRDKEKRMSNYKSPLHKMVCTTQTALWNDSCSIEELNYSIANGAVGATCNPVIVGNVLKTEMHLWKDRIVQIIEEMPTATEDDITWELIEEMSVKGAELLKPIFDREKGKNGRLSIQTDPKYYRNAKAILKQAVYFDSLAPNMIVKIPASKAGIEAIEEATYKGVSINATVCFTVPQSLSVAEAVERGLKRREKEGKDISRIGAVCTIMVGRLDDWLKLVADRDNVITDPGYLEWAGVAAMKKSYRIYKERGYRLRLLSAAFRNHMHWSEFIGGDVVISPPYKWQKRYNASDIEVIDRMDKPVDQKIIDELSEKFIDFRCAYEEDGMTKDEFDEFGPTRRTIRQFIEAYEDLAGVIRDFMIPNPDIED